MIPKKIFQTYKSLRDIETLTSHIHSPIKFTIKEAVSSFTRFIPEFEYYFYDDNECDKFMKKNF
jgi:hypothetical protein